MSNLDTTLREKFITHCKATGISDLLGDQKTEHIANWWVNRFHQLMNEKREAIEKLPTLPRSTEYSGISRHDVLSILKD